MTRSRIILYAGAIIALIVIIWVVGHWQNHGASAPVQTAQQQVAAPKTPDWTSDSQPALLATVQFGKDARTTNGYITLSNGNDFDWKQCVFTDLVTTEPQDIASGKSITLQAHDFFSTDSSGTFRLPDDNFTSSSMIAMRCQNGTGDINNVSENFSAIPKPAVDDSTGTILSYVVVSQKDISYLGCRRVAESITVPDNAAKADVDVTLQSVLDKLKQSGQWDDITVWAWRNSEKAEVGSIPATMGTVTTSSCN